MTRTGISTSPSSGKYLALASAWFSRKFSTLLEFKLEWHMYATFTIFYDCLRLQVTFLSKLLSAPDEVIVEDPRQAWLSFQRWWWGDSC